MYTLPNYCLSGAIACQRKAQQHKKDTVRPTKAWGLGHVPRKILKQMKKTRPLLLQVERWVGLPRENSNNAIPKNTMPGEVLKASRNHQDRWPYRRPENPKTKEKGENKSE